jgi:uncharacterized membrane protein YfcA
MDYFLICLVAFLGSGLTLFSGFGLGTLLVPVFCLFFPIEMAILLTAIVHFLNNIFKLLLVGQKANRQVLLSFGIPAIVFALLGAYFLSCINGMQPLGTYVLGNHTFILLPIKVCIGIVLLFFALLEIIPSWSQVTFDKKYLPIGGMLSGFFGGLSGMQGALRAAFLIRAGLSKESYIGTGVVIACLIDLSRMGIYVQNWSQNSERIAYPLVLCATLSAFLGAFLGNRFLVKVTLKNIQLLVAVLLMVFAVLLALGIL